MVSSVDSVTGAFDDLLAANRRFAESFALRGFDGVAHAGVAEVLTAADGRQGTPTIPLEGAP